MHELIERDFVQKDEIPNTNLRRVNNHFKFYFTSTLKTQIYFIKLLKTVKNFTTQFLVYLSDAVMFVTAQSTSDSNIHLTHKNVVQCHTFKLVAYCLYFAVQNCLASSQIYTGFYSRLDSVTHLTSIYCWYLILVLLPTNAALMWNLKL